MARANCRSPKNARHSVSNARAHLPPQLLWEHAIRCYFAMLSTVIQIGQREEKIGHLLGCGQNEVGQLGLGEDVTEKSRPAVIVNSGDRKVVATSAGGMHSLFLTDAGEVWSFGCNDEGALGRDTSDEGAEYEIRPIALPADCISITAGDSHSAFLLSDGRVFACGSFRDSHGTMGLDIKGKQQIPIEVVPKETFVDIKSGADHLVMLSAKGRVYSVGCGEQGQLGRVSMRSSSGESRRGKTQLLEPSVIKSRKFAYVDAIWATTYCTFLRNRLTGAIFGFGLNNYHQLGAVKSDADAIFAPMLTSFENVKNITGECAGFLWRQHEHFRKYLKKKLSNCPYRWPTSHISFD